ncbi:hypothetical protein HS7_07470 [Sulfolobales archaeon HS-7]|nr:hypothetical protein HS7_07470 [Sulfolobales archaeon HS-7]
MIGSKTTIKAIKKGKCKYVFLSNNINDELKNEILGLCTASNIPVQIYNGSGYELGALLGKPYMISCIGVIEAEGLEIRGE